MRLGAEPGTRVSRLDDTQQWLRHMDALQQWASEFRPDAIPACWSWDASEAHLADLRNELLSERIDRAPAGISRADLERDLDWEVFVEWHANRCAVCDTIQYRAVDHDHATGYIRGLLCRGCNVAEGRATEWKFHVHLRDYRGGNPPSYPFMRYQARPPAAILGLRRKNRRRNDFPAWCRLATRAKVGDIPDELKPKAPPGMEVEGPRLDDTEALKRWLEDWRYAA